MSARLILLRVVTPLFMTANPNLYQQLIYQHEDEASAYLRALQERLNKTVTPSIPGPSVKIALRKGEAADAILQHAQEIGSDLIVMSSQGRSGVGRWVYGSVAEKVLRSACCNTLIIRAQLEAELFSQGHILVPLDGSELAERALAPAREIAVATDARLTLLRVIPPVHLAIETNTMQQQSDYLESQQQAEVESYFQQILADLPRTSVKLEKQWVSGPVADQIIDYAAAHKADLIVISSHGRSGVSRWLYGSVAEKVLRGARCATLVVRGA